MVDGCLPPYSKAGDCSWCQGGSGLPMKMDTFWRSSKINIMQSFQQNQKEPVLNLLENEMHLLSKHDVCDAMIWTHALSIVCLQKRKSLLDNSDLTKCSSFFQLPIRPTFPGHPLLLNGWRQEMGRRAPLPLSLNKELFSRYSSLLEMWRSFMKKWKEALFE